MKATLLLGVVWCAVLGMGSNLCGETRQDDRGSLRERFQAGWNSSRESLPEAERNNPIYLLYWVALQDMLDTKMSVGNLIDRDRFMTIMRADAAETGVTNYTATDLERVYQMHTNVLCMFLISPSLPPRIEDWPPPDLSWTNHASGVSAFIKEHGWYMYTAQSPFLVELGLRTEQVTGLPWPEISERWFRGVTYDGILFVILDGFGPDSGGVAW